MNNIKCQISDCFTDHYLNAETNYVCYTQYNYPGI